MIFDLAAKVHFFLGLTKAKRLHEWKTIVFKANHSQRGVTPTDTPKELQDCFASSLLIQSRNTKIFLQYFPEQLSPNFPLIAAESSGYFHIIRNLLCSILGVKVRNIRDFLQKRQRRIQKRRKFPPKTSEISGFISEVFSLTQEKTQVIMDLPAIYR